MRSFVSFCAAGLLAAAGFAVSATEAQVLAIQWEGYKGSKAVAAPKVSEVKGPEGGPAVRIEAVAKGNSEFAGKIGTFSGVIYQAFALEFQRSGCIVQQCGNAQFFGINTEDCAKFRRKLFHIQCVNIALFIQHNFCQQLCCALKACCFIFSVDAVFIHYILHTVGDNILVLLTFPAEL